MTPTDNLSEFYWEKKLRQHEKSVTEYLKKLYHSLELADLECVSGVSAGGPDESFPELKDLPVFSLGKFSTENSSDDECGCGDDCSDGDDDVVMPRRVTDFSPVDAVDQLAVLWNQQLIAKLPEELFDYGLGINCAFAKLIARIADFTEPCEGIPDNLLIALGKRACAELNELLKKLSAQILRESSFALEAAFVADRLLLVRSVLTGELAELRKKSRSAE